MTTHADIFERLGEVIERLDSLEGQVGRIETKVLSYDRLKERIIGAFMAATVATAVLWWLTREKLAAVFGVQGG